MKINNYKIRPLTNGIYPEECLYDQADFFGVYKLQPDNTEDWIADFDTQEAAIEFIISELFKPIKHIKKIFTED